jgi:lipoprotein NlpI
MRNATPSTNELVQAFNDYNAGILLEDVLIAVASDEPIPHLAALNVGEAHFHIAHRALAEGNRRKAMEQFKLMEDLNCYYFYEYRWARALRERLESDPNWPASIRLP